uniref:Large ribosomal subunit protein uL29m n=1 Tax=Cacopsylla melanoneura TaxID=428564 RepID=A0A8D8V567_9HEMI
MQKLQSAARMPLSCSMFLCQRHIQMLRKFPLQKSAAIHTTSKCFDLNEFFDEPKNWGVSEVKVGRAWKIEELRLKSSSDLHKLWYVLLKEQNMLLTMEHDFKENHAYLPNPERLDKVQDSMENLEDVIRERNIAYFELETTQTGERPAELIENAFGLNEVYTKSEYDIPKEVNKEWQEKNPFINNKTRAVQKFLALLREKLARRRYAKLENEKKEFARIFANFKEVDVEAVQEKFPEVDVEEVRLSDKARGNWAP